MSERRERPIDRCPERVKTAIAHASVRNLIKRIINTAKYTEKEEE